MMGQTHLKLPIVNFVLMSTADIINSALVPEFIISLGGKN